MSEFKELMRGTPVPEEYEQDLGNENLKACMDPEAEQPKAQEMALDPFNRTQLTTAIYCDYCVAVKFAIPANSKAQLVARTPLDVVEEDGGIVEELEGFAVGYSDDRLTVIKEPGKPQKVNWAFYDKYLLDAQVLVDEETTAKRFAILKIEPPEEIKEQMEAEAEQAQAQAAQTAEAPEVPPPPHDVVPEEEEENDEEKDEEKEGEEEAHHPSHRSTGGKRRKK